MPLLDLVGKVARGAWPFIQKGVARGTSGRAALAALRAGGQRISNAAFWQLWGAQTRAWAAGTRVKYTSRDAAIDVSRLPVSLTRLRHAFSYMVEIRGRDPRKPGQSGYYVTVSTDKRLTPNQVYAAVRGMLRSRYDDSLGDQESMQLTFAQKSNVFADEE